MRKLLNIAFFYEDVFKASTFFNAKQDELKIFIDDYRDIDILSLIERVLKKPFQKVRDEEKIFIPHPEIGRLIITQKGNETIVHADNIPYELEIYLDYFREVDISKYLNAGKIKKVLDSYSIKRNLKMQ